MTDINTHIRADDFLALDVLSRELGEDIVDASLQTRTYYANDVFWQPGIVPLAVVSPRTAQEAAHAVALATGEGLSVVPRGGGMSYTKGYLPDRTDAIIMDMRQLNRVTEVNAPDRFVTAEAGVTWADLNAALKGTGLRTGYWGPLSGLNATIGGALSQNSAFFGSAQNGTVADWVMGVSVVLANGQLVTTGSGGRQATRPFTRYGGPDMTGMFLGDNGAMGIKTGATLSLIPQPPEQGFLSFGFNTLAAMADAQVQMARTGLVAEGFGIDRNKARHSASVNRISENLTALEHVAGQGKSFLGGLKDAAAVAVSGLDFINRHAYTLHIVTEAFSPAERDARLAALSKIGAQNGTALPDSVPRVMRARPFGPVRGMLGADGERWVPIHAVFPLSMAQDVVEANDAFFADRAEEMAGAGITYSVMTMTVGAEFFIEPAFYWQDELTPLHVASVGKAVQSDWSRRSANETARRAVIELRNATQDLYIGLGGVNWQVARDYPFQSVLKPETAALLRTFKAAVDPAGLMNPGALGL
ncbi:FAD-binding oxidoreductase [Pseudooceanicola sp. C21-150M6]|uniref:FAD-binding oxidoreductase n=1 Tax=Pseudooceanicola sp. C21-150M6 TaxID=3434355 RepID=UPI003D7F3A98